MEKREKPQEFSMVHCPNCRNRRLFDVGGTAQGVIQIKCPVCKNTVSIRLENCGEQRQKRLEAYYRRSRLEREPQFHRD